MRTRDPLEPVKTITITYDISQLAGLNWRGAENVLVKLLRFVIVVVIGGMLLLAAIGKLLDNRYFAEILAQWQLLPHWSLLGFGVLLSLSELLLAIWLFSGWRLAEAALLAVLFHLGYAFGTLITVLRGFRLPDCGCFGILFPHPLDWMMVFQDAALAVLCVALYLLARSKPGAIR
jgi:hypothetical protein